MDILYGLHMHFYHLGYFQAINFLTQTYTQNFAKPYNAYRDTNPDTTYCSHTLKVQPSYTVMLVAAAVYLLQ